MGHKDPCARRRHHHADWLRQYLGVSIRGGIEALMRLGGQVHRGYLEVNARLQEALAAVDAALASFFDGTAAADGGKTGN